MNAFPPSRAALARHVVQRQSSLLGLDMAQQSPHIAEAVDGRRVLVIGGAGSIGAPTVRELLGYRPSQLHVADVDENALVELMRDVRSSGIADESTDLRITPVDFSGTVMHRILRDNDGYDLVLNFAAVKHVRSERDVYSLLRMLTINVVAARQLLDWLDECRVSRYFAVSTDKAANPVNLMGATKRAMEVTILDDRVAQQVTSARFANVAFSNGSLLDGWLRRLDKRQPLSVPMKTRRYFLTEEEAGQICLLAAAVAPAGQIVFPDLDPTENLRDLVEVAEDVLSALGLEPLHCFDEDEARARMVDVDRTGRWPLLLTPLDTAGEKDFEEFIAVGDTVNQGGFSRMKTLSPPKPTHEVIDSFLERANRLVEADSLASSRDVIDCVRMVVKELAHHASPRTLDTRM